MSRAQTEDIRLCAPVLADRHTSVVGFNVSGAFQEIVLFRRELDAHKVRAGRDNARDEGPACQAVCGGTPQRCRVSVRRARNDSDPVPESLLITKKNRVSARGFRSAMRMEPTCTHCFRYSLPAKPPTRRSA